MSGTTMRLSVQRAGEEEGDAVEVNLLDGSGQASVADASMSVPGMAPSTRVSIDGRLPPSTIPQHAQVAAESGSADDIIREARKAAPSTMPQHARIGTDRGSADDIIREARNAACTSSIRSTSEVLELVGKVLHPSRSQSLGGGGSRPSTPFAQTRASSMIATRQGNGGRIGSSPHNSLNVPAEKTPKSVANHFSFTAGNTKARRPSHVANGDSTGRGGSVRPAEVEPSRVLSSPPLRTTSEVLELAGNVFKSPSRRPPSPALSFHRASPSPLQSSSQGDGTSNNKSTKTVEMNKQPSPLPLQQNRLHILDGSIGNSASTATNHSETSNPPDERANLRCMSSDSGAIDLASDALDDEESAYSHLPSKLTDSPNMSKQKVLNRIDGTEQAKTRARKNAMDAASSKGDEDVTGFNLLKKFLMRGNNDGKASSSDDGSKKKEGRGFATGHHLNPPQGEKLGKPEDENMNHRINQLQDQRQEQPQKPGQPELNNLNLRNNQTQHHRQEQRQKPQHQRQEQRQKQKEQLVEASSLPSQTKSSLPPPSSPLPSTYPDPSFMSSLSSTSSIFSENREAALSRMPAWMKSMSSSPDSSPDNNDYDQECVHSLGNSRTMITHIIHRGNWTWTTEWSPDGNRLAIATENHHLAVVDTSSSTVWKVRHDRRLTSPVKNHTTHTIRAIAWGPEYIAIGGTGDAVSILFPEEPYPVLHTIRGTGFVGSLDWRSGSNTLAIGSREDQCILVDVVASSLDSDEESKGSRSSDPRGHKRNVGSSVLCSLDRSDWVDAVSFNPEGSVLATGDRSGTLSVFDYVNSEDSSPLKLSHIRDFSLADSVLSVEWSPDGAFLYAGGEDFAVTVIATSGWEVLYHVKRDRWVQFIAPSHGGTHIAVGGSTSEVSILEVSEIWNITKNIGFGEGLIPLSAKWHPKDQYLAITGQDNRIIAVETTDVRYRKGQYLQSTSGIVCVDFSPSGKMVVVGNEDGVVSFFALTSSSLVMVYEVVMGGCVATAIKWSPDGKFVIVGGGDTVLIVNTCRPSKKGKAPLSTSGFSVRKVLRDWTLAVPVKSISISPDSQKVSVSDGTSTRILNRTDNYSPVRDIKSGDVLATTWSRDGALLATIGHGLNLTIYDTRNEDVDKWRIIFSFKCAAAGLALAWAPTVTDGLQYLAYGGRNSKVTILEIRTNEETWEKVFTIPRNAEIYDLDWHHDGMLAVAVGDGTVTIVDLGYLVSSGKAVSEMSYNWQRQGITCFTELRRNEARNKMQTVDWLPWAPNKGNAMLAVGGSDGVLEIIDLTDRRRCKGFHQE